MNKLFTISKRIAESSWFQSFIILTIIAAGVIVGIQTYGDAVIHFQTLLNRLDLVILIIFTIEVIIKVLAEGKKPWNYFKDSWNIFDFTIVAVCYLAFVLPNMDASFIAVLRLARILRVFKLITAIPKLQLLVGALLKSIPSMGYVGVLLLLLFYIYSTMGVFMFGENDPLHFGTLQRAMLSLFRVVTLEDWTDIMYINMFGCDHPVWGYGAESGCVSPKGYGMGGAAYFVSFVLIGTMIVLNLFIGVIMNSMDEARKEAETTIQLQNAALNGGYDPLNELTELTNQLDAMKAQINTLTTKLKGK